VGSSYVFLDARKPACMLKECNLGNVVTDAFVFHYAKQFASESQWTTASVAIQNSGSITSSIFVNAKGTVCCKLNSQDLLLGQIVTERCRVSITCKNISDVKTSEVLFGTFNFRTLLISFWTHFGQKFGKQ